MIAGRREKENPQECPLSQLVVPGGLPVTTDIAQTDVVTLTIRQCLLDFKKGLN